MRASTVVLLPVFRAEPGYRTRCLPEYEVQTSSGCGLRLRVCKTLHELIGEAYVAAGDRELALQSYGKALELNPQAASARKAIGELERK